MVEKNLDDDQTAERKTHLNAKIDKGLKREMKIFCAESGVTIQEFLESAIQNALFAGRNKGWAGFVASQEPAESPKKSKGKTKSLSS